MLQTTLLMMLTFAQTGLNEGQVWHDIAEVESFVTAKMNEGFHTFAVSRNDPVTGYYIEGSGAVFVVPLRYRQSRENGFSSDTSPMFAQDQSTRKADIQKRMREWREVLKKLELTRDADFEEMVRLVDGLIKYAVVKMPSLSDQDSLTFIIEERQPAWAVPRMSLSRRNSRKVVILKVDRESMQIGRSTNENETLFAQWQPDVTRITSQRATRSVLP
jgi:hypothetical protein